MMNGMLAAIPAPWSGVKASYANSKIPYRGESLQLAAGFFNSPKSSKTAGMDFLGRLELAETISNNSWPRYS